MDSSYSPLNISSSTPLSTSSQPSSVALDGQLNVIILNAFWLGTLVPISIALILTSSHLRKKPVFILNACAIACAFGFGGTTLMNAKDTLLERPASVSRIEALVILSYFIPICTQSILLIRIFAVYPLRLLSWKKNLLVYGVLGVALMARTINMGFCLHQIIADLQKSVDIFVGWTSPFVRADWFLQLFYVTYASALFLLRLREGSTPTLRGRIGTSIPYSNSELRTTYVDRLRALFWIAVFNFVFPAILSVIAIVVIFSSTDSWVLTDLVTTNLYLDVVCVLLATIWCSGKYWESPERGIKFKATMVESHDSATVAIDTPSHSRLASESQSSHSNVVFTGEGVPGEHVPGPNV
ncbi:hypothetical protein V8D89_015148 [Ganoderma adspersum]